MPNFYRPPTGGPLRWQDDVSGELPKAVHAFFAHLLEKQKPFEKEQLELVRDYLRYYINAPCWQLSTMEDQFARLRESVTKLQSAQEIDAWLRKCLEVGVDPF